MIGIKNNGTAARRLILLLGSPRSGTTWLAKILDTHPNVFYAHEPFRKARVPQVRELWDKLKAQGLNDGEREELLEQLCRARHQHVKPPFFPKSFVRCPPALRGMIWRLIGFARRGHGCFSRWFSPPAAGNHELLIKEVDMTGCVPQLIAGTRPDRLLVLVRHPCAVVHSRLKGLESGQMDSYRGGWVEVHAARCRALGFSEADLKHLDLCQFFALTWLVQNVEYLEAAAHPHAATVFYEDLRLEPQLVAGRLFRHLGWELNPRTRRFIRESAGHGLRGTLRRMLGLQHAYYGVYRNPAHDAANWRFALTPDQQHRIMDIVSAVPAVNRLLQQMTPQPVGRVEPLPAGSLATTSLVKT